MPRECTVAQPWYASLNQPPRSPADGKHRRTPAPPHRRSADRADPSAGADPTTDRTNLPAATWRTINSGANAGASASVNILPGAITSIYYLPEPPSPPPIPYAGVRAGEIIGHRLWWVLDDNTLCSFAHHFEWTPGAVVEGKVDEIVDDRFYWFKPLFGGVYSFTTTEQVAIVAKVYSRFPVIITLDTLLPTKIHGIAIGTIKCWGEVIEHELGWRAQYAKLQSIDSVIGEVDLEALRRKYLP